MWTRVSRSYFFIGAILALLLSASPPVADHARGRIVAVLAPTWNWLNTLAITSRPLANPALKEAIAKDNRRVVTAKEEIQRLELENRQLRDRVSELQALVTSERLLSEAVCDLSVDEKTAKSLTGMQERRAKELALLTTQRLLNVPARVIYRSPAAWNSTLWLNVGEEVNRALGRVVVAKNSPVVVGSALVGVIDLVNPRQSRVRLITDSSLVPAVRARREGRLLAKGEVYGSGYPLWRREGRILHGVGFNYDFADEEGPALDLRSGGFTSSQIEETRLPIIQVGDELVTSGFDGVFPAGLRVGEVIAIQPLREGDYFYELQAQPSIGDLDALSLVQVLPPVGFSLSP